MKVKPVLVIGGGVAGIEAALSLASLGVEVYLVEKEPSLGGRIAQLSYLAPTMEEALNVLTPRMKAAAENPMVKLLAYSEVVEAKGGRAAFNVTVKRKARYVDEARCDACGLCAVKCPVEVVSEFDLGLGKRKAIYTPFKGAVPAAYVIDRANCLHFKDGGCTICRDTCPRGAVNYGEEDRTVKFEAGAIILATGYDQFNPRRKREYGYGAHKDVVTGLELERMLSPTGPTGGKPVKPSTGEKPESVAIILCVGSRDETACRYCCRIGCVAGLKHAYILRKTLGDEADIYLCFNDIRTSGKGYEEFYREVRSLGITLIRGQPSSIVEDEKGKLSFKVFDEATSKLFKLNVDLVVLEVCLTPSQSGMEVQRLLQVPVGVDGFYAETDLKLKPWETKIPGVFMAGACQYPKDLAEAVTQAKAAALEALTFLKLHSPVKLESTS